YRRSCQAAAKRPIVPRTASSGSPATGGSHLATSGWQRTAAYDSASPAARGRRQSRSVLSVVIFTELYTAEREAKRSRPISPSRGTPHPEQRRQTWQTSA